MNADIEEQSDNLIAQMHKLQRTVTQSFKKTDELLDYYGLNRTELKNVMTKVRSRLSQAELEALNSRELEWKQLIKTELQTNRGDINTGDQSAMQTTKRVRTALMGKI